MGVASGGGDKLFEGMRNDVVVENRGVGAR